MTRLFLGVDGGQSSTTALIGDEAGRIVGFGRGGPCNHVGAAEGRAKFLNAIGGCIGDACRQAGMAGPQFEGACLGFSGGPADKETLVRELIESQHLFVTDDGLVGLVGACAGQAGLITIGGTGSIAYGRSVDGRLARAGGWGYIFGDEGGAFDIVRQALRSALRFEEGWGESTSLRETLLAATGYRTINEVMHEFYTEQWPRSRVATLSKLVDEAARQGDAVAQRVIDGAAEYLAGLAAAVRMQLFAPGELAKICYIGGVFRSDRLRNRFMAQAEAADSGNRVGPPTYGPAAGALLEAYRRAGIATQLSNVPEFEK